MAILKRIVLVNACQHKHLDISLGPGITAILGDNGSGKTNTLGMVKANIINEYKHMPGTKDRNIRRNIDSKDAAFTQTEWETQQGTLELRRGLQACKSHLLLNGSSTINSKPITKEAEITDTALKILGFSKDAVSKFLFADFNELAQIVSGTKASRSEMLGSLCGLQRIVNLEKILAAEMSYINGKVDGYDPEELDTAEMFAKQSVKQLEQVQTAIKETEEAIAKVGSLKAVEQEVAKIENVTERRRELSDELRKYRDRRRKLKQKQREYREELVTAKQVVKAQTKQQKKLQTKIKVTESMTFEVLCGDLLALPSELAQVNVVHGETVIGAYVKSHQKNQKTQQYMLEHANAKCEVCGSFIDMDEDEQRSLGIAIQEDHEIFCRVVKELKLSRAELVQTLQSAKEDLEETQTTLADAKADISTKSQWLKEVKPTIKELSELITEYETKLHELPSNRKVTVEQQKRLDRSRNLHEQLFSLKGNLATVQERVKQTTAQHEKAKAKAKQYAAQIYWMELVKQSRAVCHRDRLQTTVIQSVAGPLVSVMNHFLGELEMQFRASLDVNEFSFLIDHGDGNSELAERLSHGQKLAFGIAFWLARSRVFCQELPLFLLDEPSANFDEANELEFSRFIGKLSLQLENEGRQGIIITHSPVVAASASHSHKLETASY